MDKNQHDRVGATSRGGENDGDDLGKLAEAGIGVGSAHLSPADEAEDNGSGSAPQRDRSSAAMASTHGSCRTCRKAHSNLAPPGPLGFEAGAGRQTRIPAAPSADVTKSQAMEGERVAAPAARDGPPALPPEAAVLAQRYMRRLHGLRPLPLCQKERMDPCPDAPDPFNGDDGSYSQGWGSKEEAGEGGDDVPRFGTYSAPMEWEVFLDEDEDTETWRFSLKKQAGFKDSEHPLTLQATVPQEDMYMKSSHEPGDGIRSTPEAWGAYLNKEEEAFGRLSGVLKLLSALKPRSEGQQQQEDDPRWDDVRRYLREASEEHLEAAMKEKDTKGRIPLHLVCWLKPPKDVVKALLDAWPDSVFQRDAFCWIPLHWACDNLASVDIIRLLIKMGGDHTCKATNVNHSIPLHYACYRGAAVDIIRVLVDAGGKDSCRIDDKQGRCPLYYGFRGPNKTPEKKLHDDAVRCVIEAGGAEPLKDILHIEHDDQAKCMSFSETKVALNHGFTKRPVIVVVMLDFYAQLFLVAFLSASTSRSFERKGGMDTCQLVLLSLILFWLTIREVIQMITFSYQRYVMDFWNWLDVSQIALVIASTSLLNSREPIPVDSFHRVILTVTVGMVWFELVGVLKNFLYGIAIFVVSLQEIVFKLVPFLAVTAVTISAFVFMFHSANNNAPYCSSDYPSAESQWYCGTTGRVFAELSSYVLGELDIDADIAQDSKTTAGILYIFGFVMALIFLNVLIAKISNVFCEVEHSGNRFFWRNRYSVVAEALLLIGMLRRCVCCLRKKPIFPCAQEGIIAFFGAMDRSGTEEVRERLFKPRRAFRDVSFSGSPLRFLCQELERFGCRMLCPIVLLGWFFLGLLSCGILWPKWMTRWLFSGNVSEDDGSAFEREMKKRNDAMDDKIDDVNNTIVETDAKITAVDSKIEELDVKISDKITELDAKIEELDAKVSDNITGMDAKIEELDVKISDKITGLDAKIEELDAKVSDKITGMDAKIEVLDVKISDKIIGMDAKIAAVHKATEEEIGGVNAKIAVMNANIAGMDVKIAGLDYKMNRIEEKIDKVLKAMLTGIRRNSL